MKITEITQPSIQSITESIDSTNNSRFITEDLVGIVEAHQANDWQSYDADSYIQSLLEGKMPWAAK